MAVATLTGHGDPAAQELPPATASPDRVALVGLHSWAEDDFPNIADWGIWSFGPDERADPPGPCATGSRPPAARAPPSTSTSTRSTATRSRSVSASNRAAHERRGAAHRRRRRRGRGRRRVHARGAHPPTGDAPAADPGRLPACFRNDAGLTPGSRPRRGRRPACSPGQRTRSLDRVQVRKEGIPAPRSSPERASRRYPQKPRSMPHADACCQLFIRDG